MALDFSKINAAVTQLQADALTAIQLAQKAIDGQSGEADQATLDAIADRVKGIDATRGVTFDFPLAAYQAAMDGLGVALGRNPLVAPDLKSGRLVVPFDFKMSTELAYYMVYPAEAIRRRKIKAFRDWLLPLAEVQVGAKAA